MPNGLRAFERLNIPLMEEINSGFFNHAQKIVIHRNLHLKIIDFLKTSNLGKLEVREFGQSVANATMEMYLAGDTYRKLIANLRDSGMDEVINIAVPIVLKDYHSEKIPRKNITILQQAGFSSEDIENTLKPAINRYIVNNILKRTERKGLFAILERAPRSLRLLATYYLADCIEAGLIFFSESSKGNPSRNLRQRIRKAQEGLAVLGNVLQSLGGGILIGTDVASGASVASLLSIGGGLVAFGRAIEGVKNMGK